MASEPSLGEILNFGVDPSLGGGTPSVPFDNRQLIQTVNDNAKFQAENAWKRYGVFQDQLADLYKNIGDVSKLEVATEDREALDKDRKELLDNIWKSPKEFFGSGNAKKRAEIEASLSKYRSNATESKLNKVYDMAHRQFMEQNPELNTDENKQVIDSYWQQPLGKRKSYNLNMPTVFDYGKFSQDIFKTPGVSKSSFGYQYSPDKHFMQEVNTTTLNKDAFMRNWNAGLLSTDKYGHSIRTWAEQQFKQLTPEQKKNLKVESPEDLWHTIGEQTFGSQKDIVTSEKGKLLPNYFERDMMRAEQQMKMLRTRYGLMAGLEAIKQGNRKDLETFKQTVKGQSPEQQAATLDNLTEGMVNGAIEDGNVVEVNGKQLFKMPSSDIVLGVFNKKLGFGMAEQPAEIAVSPDGADVTTIYYDSKGAVDPAKTRTFPVDEFKVEFGKTVFGVTGVRKLATVKKPGAAKPKAQADPLGIRN